MFIKHLQSLFSYFTKRNNEKTNTPEEPTQQLKTTDNILPEYEKQISTKVNEITNRCKLYRSCLDDGENLEKRNFKIAELLGNLFNQIRDTVLKDYGEYAQLLSIRFDKLIYNHILRFNSTVKDMEIRGEKESTADNTKVI
jgi:hypothetical protein